MHSKNLDKIEGVFDVDTVSSFKDLLEKKNALFPDKERWIFRGEESAEWRLKTIFERAMDDSKLKDQKPWEYEAAILREFIRRAHHYISEASLPKNVLEWFALMRHYGAPCRLLDCTYSFYIAMYFALRKPRKAGDSDLAAIWAINTDWIYECLCKTFNKGREEFTFKDPNKFYNYFLDHNNPQTFVSYVNPFRMNQRLTAQQGVFLCPGDISKPFMNNFVKPGTQENPKHIIRIPIVLSSKTEVIQELRRMNITSATLFPDLPGFAESLSDWFHLGIRLNEDELVETLMGKFPGETQESQLTKR